VITLLIPCCQSATVKAVCFEILQNGANVTPAKPLDLASLDIRVIELQQNSMGGLDVLRHRHLFRSYFRSLRLFVPLLGMFFVVVVVVSVNAQTTL